LTLNPVLSTVIMLLCLGDCAVTKVAVMVKRSRLARPGLRHRLVVDHTAHEVLRLLWLPALRRDDQAAGLASGDLAGCRGADFETAYIVQLIVITRPIKPLAAHCPPDCGAGMPLAYSPHHQSCGTKGGTGLAGAFAATVGG
jgi:hypothetical protein